MNFLEKLGLLWTLYWFTQSAMHSSVYFIINSEGAASNARASLILSVPGIILFLVGNYVSIKDIINRATYIESCEQCGFEKNEIDFEFCSNCGHRLK